MLQFIVSYVGSVKCQCFATVTLHRKLADGMGGGGFVKQILASDLEILNCDTWTESSENVRYFKRILKVNALFRTRTVNFKGIPRILPLNCWIKCSEENTMRLS
jgi:hypothetical protein